MPANRLKLVWKPPSALEVRTKEFVKDFVSATREISLDRLFKTGPYLLPHGQQRLRRCFSHCSEVMNESGYTLRRIVARQKNGRDTNTCSNFASSTGPEF